MVGGIRFEHTHRLIAGFVAILTLILTVVVFRTETRKWLRGLAALALGTVLLQAVLGGLTVIYMLPDWISVAHACLAQTFFCLVAVVALCTGCEWRQAAPAASVAATPLQRLLCVTTGFIYLQLVAGAIVRHSGKGIAWHVLGAFLIALHVFFAIVKIATDETARTKLFGHAAGIGMLVIAQIFLGLAAFIFTRMLERGLVPTTGEVLFTTAHQTIGALILAGTVLLTARTYRLLAPVAASA